MKIPNTISQNTYKAYIDTKNDTGSQAAAKRPYKLNAINLDWDSEYVESLRILTIRKIAENWHTYPIFKEIKDLEDKNFLLDIIDVNIDLKLLSAHIIEDVFWKRCFVDRWPKLSPQKTGKAWISLYMEQYLIEMIEQMKPSDYNEENVQNLVEVCAAHVRTLKIIQLQPSLDEQNDHIPFDVILGNLSELRKIDITFDLKTIGSNFFLGCSNISKNDIKHFACGLEKCYELLKFRMHSSKLEPFMLKLLARALEKGCSYLEWLNISHCHCGDAGLSTFLANLSHDSFLNLKHLILTNNNLSHESALQLALAIKRRDIETLDLRLNPILSDGAAAIFGILNVVPIINLNLSCCSITGCDIEILLLTVLRDNKIIKRLNLSSNKLGMDLGGKIAKTIVSARQLQELDVRNTGITAADKWIIDSKILDNRDKA